MSIRLLFITNNPDIARVAEEAGVDWIFVDLEYRGKAERQKGRRTVISYHTIEDAKLVRRVLRKSKLLIRINPIGEWTKDEIEQAIVAGADIIMLPMFFTAKEVERFIGIVGRRARTCLLLETMSAIANLEEILEVEGVDYIHVGLNDLHIERRTRFMFEFLGDASMDQVATKIKGKGIPFGFGGIARMEDKIPPGKRILAEHYRLGSTGVILSRTFCDPSQFKTLEDFAHFFKQSVEELRREEYILKNRDESFFEKNRLIVKAQIAQVAKSLGAR